MEANVHHPLGVVVSIKAPVWEKGVGAQLLQRVNRLTCQLTPDWLYWAPYLSALAPIKEVTGVYRNPIKEWLGANKKPQTWLAEQVGVTRQSVYAWCKGVARPDVDRAHQIAQLTGLSLEELLDPRVVGREIRAARPHQIEAA